MHTTLDDPGQSASGATPRVAAPLRARTTLMFVQIFLIVGSFTMSKAVRDGVFLARFAMRDLAHVSLLLAVLAGAGVSLHTRFVAQRFSRGAAASVTLFAVAASLVLFAVGLNAHLRWLPWALYVWTGVFGVFLVSQFWVMALAVFDPREAKRVYAFVAAGASLGGVGGGYFAQRLSHNLGEAGLLMLVAAVFAVCGGIARVAWAVRPIDDKRDAEVAAGSRRGQVLDGVRAVRKSPLLRVVALLLLCSIVAGTLLDWQVKAIAQAHYGRDRERMTAFFGQLMAYASIAAVVLQAATGPFLRRAGVSAGLLVLPLGLLGGALILVGQPELGISPLVAAAIAKTSEGGARFSIDKAAVELLYMPLQAPDLAAGKVVVDTIADRAGGAVTAVLWLCMQAAFGVDSPARVHFASYAVIAIVVVWIVVARLAGRRYLGSFRAALARLELRPERVTGRLSEAAQRHVLQSALGGERAAEVLLALDVLAEPENRAARVDVRPALRHRHAAVRARALEVLAMRRDIACVPVAARLLDDAGAAVRLAATRWAMAVGPRRVLAALGDRATPGARRLLETAALPSAERARALATLSRSSVAGDRATAAVLAAGTHDVALFQLLRRDPDPVVANAAIAAVASQRDPRDIPFLLEAGARPATREQAVEALALHGVCGDVVRRLADPAAPGRERAAAAEALARTRLPAAVQPLQVALRDSGGELRDRVLRALEKHGRDTGVAPDAALVAHEIEREIRSLGRLAAAVEALPEGIGTRDPADAVTALARRAAVEALDAGFARLFKLIGLVTTPKEMRDVYLSLIGGDARTRATIVEYLENLVPAPLRSRIVPIVEAEPGAERRRAIMTTAGVRPVATVAAALAELAEHDDAWVRAVAAAALLRHGLRAEQVPHRDREDDPRVQQVFATAS